MYNKLIVFFLGLFLFSACQLNDPDAPVNDFKVHAYYVVPNDQVFLETNANLVARGILETQRWYQTATGGLTFELLDEENIITVYFAERSTAYYEDDWWNLLLTEMRDRGEPIESPGTIAMIWVEGIQQLTATVAAFGADMCDGQCGAAILPITTVIGPTWPPEDISISYHEMGHTLGLTHPVTEEDLPLPPEQEPVLYSIMCQAPIRLGTSTADHGFLTNEKAILYDNPFMKKSVSIYQNYWYTRIINYPVTGPAPTPDIISEPVGYRTYSFDTNYQDGLLYYWYFGDGYTSNDPSPTHQFNSTGLYNVTLLVTGQNQMATRVSQYVEIR